MTEAVRVLIEAIKNDEDNSKRVDVNVQDGYNYTALHIACCNGDEEIVKLLLETLKLEDVDRRVRLDLKNHNGKTALDIAKSRKETAIVKLIQNALTN